MLFLLFHLLGLRWDFVQVKGSGYLSAFDTFPLAWFPLGFCSAEQLRRLKCCSYFSIGCTWDFVQQKRSRYLSAVHTFPLAALGILFSRRGLDA